MYLVTASLLWFFIPVAAQGQRVPATHNGQPPAVCSHRWSPANGAFADGQVSTVGGNCKSSAVAHIQPPVDHQRLSVMRRFPSVFVVLLSSFSRLRRPWIG